MEDQEEKKKNPEDDDEEDEEEGSVDPDAIRKKVQTEYEPESQSEAGSDTKMTEMNPEQGDMIELPEEKQEQQRVRTDLDTLKKFDREKYSKFLPFIKGDLEFVDNSASISL